MTLRCSMSKNILILSVILLVLSAGFSFAASADPIEFEGISLGMKKASLIANWGYPSKREKTKWKEEVWFYLNENTTQPADGVVVYLDRSKVSDWRVVDNLYEEMRIAGKRAGISIR